jgi:hypothetical protein
MLVIIEAQRTGYHYHMDCANGGLLDQLVKHHGITLLIYGVSPTQHKSALDTALHGGS